MQEQTTGTPSGSIHREDVNNHIHTHYSFSPYSPTQAVLRAKEAGLATAGIMDHDSLAGADEFEQAGRLHGMPTTVGMEVRADFSHTALAGRRINNPDQSSIAYIALHGVPRATRAQLTAFLRPYQEARMIRNRIMTRRINALVAPYDLAVDFDADVLPLSKWVDGGAVTERHLLYALTLKMLGRFGREGEVIPFLRDKLALAVSDKQAAQLSDPSNPHMAYDLLGILKGGLVSQFYVDATAECPDIRTLAKAAHDAGAILAYAYLGDVTDSVTGDKKSQAFEDEYLDLLFDTLKSLGFDAVTYMPSRNTAAQLERLRTLCDRNGFFQISGEDINSSRQSFVCEAMRAPGFENLVDAAWALIGHETASAEHPENGMFSAATLVRMPDLAVRTAHFAELGRAAHGKARSAT